MSATAAPGAPAVLPANGLTSVVVVAADSGAGLLDCAASVLGSAMPIELVVVDNASQDGAVDALRARWPNDARVVIVGNERNLGFGAGCNRGAAVARGDALLFLNPDCVIDSDTVARLRVAVSNGVGLVGATIVDASGTVDAASRRRDPLLRRALMTMSGLSRFEPGRPYLAGVMLPPRIPAPEFEPVDAISGALMLLPRPVFERIGGFDENYFLHAEDLDLCRRVRDAGYPVICANAIRVVHGKGGSSRRRPLFVSRHKHRGLWRWFVKFDPAARNPLLRGLVWSGIWLHFAAIAPAAAVREYWASRKAHA